MNPAKLSALAFPRTMPRHSLPGGLAPWLRPLCFLRPGGFLQSGLDEGLQKAGLVESIAAGKEPEKSGPDQAELVRLLQDWELWLVQERGSGRAESLKAGLKPPPRPETVRGLMKDIVNHGKPKPGEEKAPPEVTAELLLHLAHLQELQADEVESLIRKAESGRDSMSRVMGLVDEDSLPEEYAKVLAKGLPPFDYDEDEERLLAQKMNAWALVAGPQAFADRWPVASGLAAARLLMERHRGLMGRADTGQRSPAGAQVLLSAPEQNPEPDSGLAQEGLRLLVPDLSGLPPEELAALAAKLDGREEYAALRADLPQILQMIVSEPWSRELKDELTGQALALSRTMAELAPGHGSLNLSLIVFPGLLPEGLPGLMRENPENWTAPDPAKGSCPLLVAWRG